jgi:CRISPR-associated protein Csd1
MLQALMAYGSGLDSEPGFKTREVRWYVELAADGRFLTVLPLGDGKRGQMQPRCPDMHGMNAGGKSHFLVETTQTATLLFKSNEDPKKIANSADKHHFFVDMLRKASDAVPTLTVLANTLANETKPAEIREALTQHKAKPTDWLSWRVGDADPREDTAVQEWWRGWRRADMGDGSPESAASSGSVSDGSMVCFLTGAAVQPLPTHPKITGLSGVGGLGTGDVMVGFEKRPLALSGWINRPTRP